jgi:hypothetical protein
MSLRRRGRTLPRLQYHDTSEGIEEPRLPFTPDDETWRH